ncbi:hypothetical protein [Asanoa siamensis]|uniref:GerMN domain-containing protein n=1 Tax=Asanoa siamensis TaxID=926357 RepID=A0ABQ4CQR0_9ACTN|nr:hypothetical protein [Asanoa siamensis]GIF73622.1 hypothetical protein Asi02nite_31400 [Asanoa siamensis]
MRRAAAAGLLLVFLLAGCGVRPSDVIIGGPAPVGTVGGARIYLLVGDEPSVVLRGPRTALPADVLTELADGPTPAERQQGFNTEVPPEIAPAKLGFSGDGTVVSLSADVDALSVLGVVQIVCTVQAVTSAAPVTLVRGEQRRGPLTCPKDL